MINKVDGNNYYDYTTPKKIEIPDTGEKFSLNYKREESPSDLKNRKEEEVSDSDKAKAKTVEQGGVRLDLSGDGRSADAEGRKQTEETSPQTVSGQTSLLERIQTVLTAALTAIREFFYNIWNDPQSKSAQDTSEELKEADIAEVPESEDSTESAETEEFPEEAKALESAGEAVIRPEATESKITEEIETVGIAGNVDFMDEEARDREIRQQLQKGNVDQAINILTDNGRKTVARNSNLLTSYDKNGRLVRPNISIGGKNLYGDKNTRKQ